jgi:hypothetical protein
LFGSVKIKTKQNRILFQTNYRILKIQIY